MVATARATSPIGLRDGDREQLERWVRSSTIPGGLAQRARIVLLAADGVPNVVISERLEVSEPTVSWRFDHDKPS
jgi:hypothetical protein